MLLAFFPKLYFVSRYWENRNTCFFWKFANQLYLKQKKMAFKFYIPFWVTIKTTAGIFVSPVKKSSSFLKLHNQMNNF